MLPRLLEERSKPELREPLYALLREEAPLERPELARWLPEAAR
jgi:hypothetical protein